MRTQPLNVQMSNKLYHGNVTDVDDALTTLVNGLRAEVAETRRWNAALDSNDPQDEQFRLDEAPWQAYQQVAQQALALLHEEQRAATQRAIERIRALGGEDAERIADALEAEAYDELAW